VWAQAIAFVACILGTLVSNLGCENDCLKFFVIFPSFSRPVTEYYLKLGHGRFLSYPCVFIIYFRYLLMETIWFEILRVSSNK